MTARTCLYILKFMGKKKLLFGSLVFSAVIVLMAWSIWQSTSHNVVASSTQATVADDLSNTTEKSAFAQSGQMGEGRTLPPISPEVAEEIRRLVKRNEQNHVKDWRKMTAEEARNGPFQHVIAASVDNEGKVVVAHGEDFLNNIQK